MFMEWNSWRTGGNLQYLVVLPERLSLGFISLLGLLVIFQLPNFLIWKCTHLWFLRTATEEIGFNNNNWTIIKSTTSCWRVHHVIKSTFLNIILYELLKYLLWRSYMSLCMRSSVVSQSVLGSSKDKQVSSSYKLKKIIKQGVELRYKPCLKILASGPFSPIACCFPEEPFGNPCCLPLCAMPSLCDMTPVVFTCPPSFPPKELHWLLTFQAWQLLNKHKVNILWLHWWPRCAGPSKCDFGFSTWEAVIPSEKGKAMLWCQQDLSLKLMHLNPDVKVKRE